MIPGTNLTYEQLMTAFMPRPIQSEAQYWQTQAHIDALLDKEDLTTDEQDYLTMLGLVIERYEDDNEPDFELRGAALIKALLEEQGLRQHDLVPIFKTDSIVSAVLNGKRSLTVEHINKLAAFFNLPHDLFFEPLVQSPKPSDQSTSLSAKYSHHISSLAG